MPSFEVEKLTNAIIDAAKPEATAYFITEKMTRGFGVRIGSRGKTFFVRRRLHGTTHRPTLGTYPALLVDKAREAAIRAWAMMEQQIHPNDAKKKRKDDAKAKAEREQWTLAVLLPLYLAEERDKPLAETTVKGYNSVKTRLEKSPIWKKPIVNIEAATDLRAAYDYLIANANQKNAKNGGKTTAAQIMRYVSVILNYGLKEKLGGLPNPFEAIPDRQKWEQPKARNRTIIEKEDSLASWWKAVDELRTKDDGRSKDSKVIADFLQLSLLFGSRKTELLTLTWNCVDFEDKTVLFEKTKNGKQHQIPLGAKSFEILKKAFGQRAELPESERSEYVFPASRTGYKSKTKTYIKEPKYAIERVVNGSGVEFSPHDLRRTFGSLLGEIGASFYQTKAALNHAAGGDVSQKHYIRIRLRALRDIFERVEKTILEEAKVIKSDAETACHS